jgi:protocatechuate 3,4-dioxygenase beta subunit
VEGIPELSGANAVSVDPDEHRLISLSLGSYDLSISGRVLDRAGSPLQGVVVFAQKQIFGGRDEQVRHANPSSLRVTSRSDGSYEISGLDATDYLVHTEATEDFPPVRKIYRAGVTSADLILDVAQALEIYGTVTSEDGSPLEGVQVRAVGQTRQQRMTDAAGEYTVQLSLRPGHTTHSLVARKAGFRENRTNVRMAEIGEAESWEVDIRLQPMGAQVAVVGQVVDTGGNPVGSQTVHLHSAVNSARYKGISDLDGNFSIEAVQVGSDYRLWIYPPEGYRDYSRVVVEVAEAGAEMDIVLEELGLGSVRGTIVDSLGNAVPQFALWLRSMKALGNSISVTGDDAGEFVAEEVPEGELHFETRSLPRMTVRGIRLAADEVKDVRLVLDWGELSLTGTVLDETGDPVASANVLLNWKHNAKGILSSSFRNTVTDAQGSFKFSGLGAGDHRIEVSTPSHGSAKVQHEVGGSGSDPVIRLEAR